jgi:methionyl-tRNA formyltransferase
MNENKLILLCGSRMALPLMRDLVFYKQLGVVVIPEHCTEFIQQVQLLLKDMSIPVLVVNRKNYVSELEKAIKKYTINIGLMATFTYKLPAAVFRLPAKGFFNLHPGPLPAYRGPDPIFQQIRNQEAFAGITLHKVEEDFDTGAIVLYERIKLLNTDTYGTVTTKLSELSSRMVNTLIKMTGFDFEIPSRPQDQVLAKYFPRQGAADITIDWKNMDASSIIALMNACNPWNKGAVALLNNKIIRLLEGEKLAEKLPNSQEPGTIIRFTDHEMEIACLNGECLSVWIISVDEGIMSAGRLLQQGINTGSRFQ